MNKPVRNPHRSRMDGSTCHKENYIKNNKEKPEPTGEICPECGKELVKRKSRYGKFFVGCSGYPKCRYIKKEEKQ